MERMVFDPNPSLQLTAGSFGLTIIIWQLAGFGWSNVLRQTPAATELGR